MTGTGKTTGGRERVYEREREPALRCAARCARFCNDTTVEPERAPKNSREHEQCSAVGTVFFFF